MTIIYGLREVGSGEIRYVGRTNHPLEKRLREHKWKARHNYPRRLCEWISAAGEIEIIPLAECAPESACRVERQTVRDIWQRGDRLTNGHLVPRGTTTQQGAA